jgi:uncharacterized Ntn-hydrolase superfamily protein
LDGEEVREMIGWVIALPEVVEEVLAELEETVGAPIAHGDHILWQWKDDESWLRDHPAEAARVVRYLAKQRAIEPWMEREAINALRSALAAGAAHATVESAAEALVAAMPAATGPLQYLEELRITAGASPSLPIGAGE